MWIHGGTFNFGGKDVIYEDPTPLVEQENIIVVKFNYRLGPFANWYFEPGETNFGLSDQVTFFKISIKVKLFVRFLQ